LEEALDLSFDRLRMMMMMMFSVYADMFRIDFFKHGVFTYFEAFVK